MVLTKCCNSKDICIVNGNSNCNYDMIVKCVNCDKFIYIRGWLSDKKIARDWSEMIGTQVVDSVEVSDNDDK